MPFHEAAKKVAHILDTKISLEVNKMKISKTLLIPIVLMIGSCCAIFEPEISNLKGEALLDIVVDAPGNLHIKE